MTWTIWSTMCLCLVHAIKILGVASKQPSPEAQYKLIVHADVTVEWL